MKAGHSLDPDKHIPDLSGKVILVTGGNAGLGRETVLQLSKHNPAHIYLAARSQAKGQAAIEELKRAVPNGPPISFLQLDLSSFKSIKGAVKTFRESSTRLDLLINNAGIMATPEGLTEDGYEIQFGTNHMGHALLTSLLLPTLKQTAAMASSDVRVVFLSSALESNAPKDSYHLDRLKSTMPHISTWARYGMSKLANIHYGAALAQRNSDIKFVSVHPGIVQTNLSDPFANNYNRVVSGVLKAVSKFMGVSVEKGALNQLWAATSPNAKSGVFYYPVGVTGKGSKLAEDEKTQEELWNWTEKEIQEHLF